MTRWLTGLMLLGWCVLVAPVEAAKCRTPRGKLVVTIKDGGTVTDWVAMIAPVWCRQIAVPAALAELELGGLAEARPLDKHQLWKRLQRALAAQGLAVKLRAGRWQISGTPKAAPAVGGIRKLGATSFELDRALVDAALTDPMSLTVGVELALAVDEQGNGAGFELTRVAPGSLLARIGLGRGDVIEWVNGRTLKDAGDAIAAVEALRGSASFSLGVSRYGVQRTMTYRVR